MQLVLLYLYIKRPYNDTYYTCYSLYLVWVGGNFLTWCWASKVSRCLRCGCCERRGHTTVPPQLTPQRRTSARRKVAHLRDRAPFQSLNHRWASKELASLVLFIDDRSLARSILIAFSAMKSNPAFILHCMPDESSPSAPLISSGGFGLLWKQDRRDISGDTGPCRAGRAQNLRGQCCGLLPHHRRHQATHSRAGGATEAQRLLHTVWARDTVVILL
jgi:hypothetical protein